MEFPELSPPYQYLGGPFGHRRARNEDKADDKYQADGDGAVEDARSHVRNDFIFGKGESGKQIVYQSMWLARAWSR